MDSAEPLFLLACLFAVPCKLQIHKHEDASPVGCQQSLTSGNAATTSKRSCAPCSHTACLPANLRKNAGPVLVIPLKDSPDHEHALPYSIHRCCFSACFANDKVA